MIDNNNMTNIVNEWANDDDPFFLVCQQTTQLPSKQKWQRRKGKKRRVHFVSLIASKFEFISVCISFKDTVVSFFIILLVSTTLK